MEFLLKALIVGFAMAVPVGPVNVLCMRRTLARGRLAGFISGLGAATVDAMYAGVSAFGLTFISSVLLREKAWFKLVGGAILFAWGVKAYLTKPAKEEKEAKAGTLVGDFISAWLLTLANPSTVLTFAAVFAILGLGEASDKRTWGFLVVAGVFLGSALWWLVLAEGVAYFRAKFDDNMLKWANRLTGILLAAFGLVALASGLKSKI